MCTAGMTATGWTLPPIPHLFHLRVQLALLELKYREASPVRHQSSSYVCFFYPWKLFHIVNKHLLSQWVKKFERCYFEEDLDILTPGFFINFSLEQVSHWHYFTKTVAVPQALCHPWEKQTRQSVFPSVTDSVRCKARPFHQRWVLWKRYGYTRLCLW